MIIQSTAKAEAMLANASDARHDPGQVLFPDFARDSIDTFRSRAPLEVFPIIDVSPCEKFMVTGEH